MHCRTCRHAWRYCAVLIDWCWDLGDHKFCGEGVWELRINVGPAYRVYYAQQGKRVVLLLCGGSKRTQQSDIRKAIRYWQDFQQRSA